MFLNPTVFTFLSTEKVRDHLHNYFKQSQQARSTDGVDHDLYLLYIRCFEVRTQALYLHVEIAVSIVNM